MTAPVPFDGVFKMVGVWASGCNSAWVQVQELDEGICIRAPSNSSGKFPSLTVPEARSLAAQIMEAARRHEIRKAQTK